MNSRIRRAAIGSAAGAGILYAIHAPAPFWIALAAIVAAQAVAEIRHARAA